MSQLVSLSRPTLPVLVAASGRRAGVRFLEFFTAQIRNPHTRRAYARAVTDFLSWCESIGVTSLHVNLTGDYTWHTNKRVAKGGFRPLRIPRTGFAKP
jgi:hypothetical protein